jgi:two-component system LytT family sensor kinase
MFFKKSAFIHTIIWVLLVGLMLILQSRTFGWSSLIIVLPYGVMNILIFYLAYFWLAPLMVIQQKIWRSLLFLCLVILVTSFLKYAFALQFEDTLLKYGEEKQHTFTFWQYYISAIIMGLFFALLGSVLYIIISNIRQQQLRKSLETEKLNAELSFLKFQINPHFLFNSLNNIYALAYKQSPKTPEAILKLSDMMRYMLYESNDEKVLLAKEIQYLNNFIDLQRLRSKDEVHIDWQVHLGEVESEKCKVMPLLLISFLENAFKHGVSDDPAKPIRVLIQVEGNRLHFRVENEKKISHKDETHGVGLDNLKRRLQLGYPEKHTIQVTDAETYYIGELFLYL